MEQATVLIVEDSPLVLHGLRQGLSPRFRVTEGALRRLTTLTDWWHYLLARCQRVDGQQRLCSEDGMMIDAVGLNAHVCISGVRNLGTGVALLERLCREFRANIPVVLWSFLPLAQLQEQHNSLRELDGSYVFLHLPTDLAGFRTGFEDAIAQHRTATTRASLSANDENPLRSLDATIRQEGVRLIIAAANAFQPNDNALEGAVTALHQNDPEPLLVLLRGLSWRTFVKAARDLTKYLARIQPSIREAEDLGRLANSLCTFEQWWTQQASPSSLAEQASWYTDWATGLPKTLEQLLIWARDYITEGEQTP